MSELAAIQTLAFRDFIKFLRDPTRIIATFVFPLVFIAALGGSMQANLPPGIGFDYLSFVFTGVYAQTLFQTTAFGLISLIEDRENDYTQEIFVSPISRYSILIGKILGETLVAMPQAIGVILFGLLVGVPITGPRLIALIWVGIVVCFAGGAFGLLVLSNISSQRAANQIFPFIVLPQYFLSGLFSPIKVLPPYLDVLSRISPMRYAVDFTRDFFYFGTPEYDVVVLAGPAFNGSILLGGFLAFLIVGTALFVRREQNK